MTVFTLACRNVRRHAEKTIPLGLTVILASFLMTFGNAYGDSVLKVMTDRLTGFYLGHLTVHAANTASAPNFFESRFPPLTNSARIAQALQSDPAVAAVTARIKWVGIMINGDKALNVSILGVDPVMERQVAPSMDVVEGRWLEADETEGVLVSQAVMRKNGWRVGDQVTLMTSAGDGFPSGLNLRIVGVLKPNGFDYFTNSNVIIPLKAAARLTYLPVGGNELAVRLHDPGQSSLLKKTFQPRIAGLGGSIQTNEEFAPLLWSIAAANKLPWQFLSAVILILVVMGILVAMVASILERLQEFGTMLSIGYTYRYIQKLIYAEVLVLGVGATLIGVALALLVVALLHCVGLPALVNLQALSYGGDRLFITTSWHNPAMVIAVSILTALAAGVYPARLIRRLNPMEALRRC
ncbi:MAG: FtsX-like permease family protein [bacterium]